MVNILIALSLLAATVLAVPKCPPPGSTSFLLPHKNDCTKFYICSHGTPVLQRCPGGTHFNPTFMVCVWPYESNCRISHDGPQGSQDAGSQDSGSQDGEFQDGGSQDGGFQEGVSQDGGFQDGGSQDGGFQDGGSQDSGFQDGGSQDSGADATWYHRCRSGALSKHKKCTKYYICVHGVKVPMDCPSGLQWSSKLKQCAWPHESDCGDKDGRLCKEGEFSANKDCRKYNICNHGAFLAMDCPAGLHWNSRLSECVWPHESNCKISQDGPQYGRSQDAGSQDGGYQDGESQDGGTQDEEYQDGGFQDGGSEDGGSQAGAIWYHRCRSGALSKHKECTKYYICFYGFKVAMDCPSGLQWSSKLKQCTSPHESDCGVKDGRLCEEGELSANKDCRKYNICNHGAFLAMNCPAGLQWNSRLSQCAWPFDSDCGVKDGGVCKDGELSANKDCRKYNICNHGAFLAMNCPPGLHWNSRLSMCDWPVSAGCKK